MSEKKKLLVSGAAGFIGTNFLEKALSKGHKILAIDCLKYSGIKNNVNRFNDKKNFEFKKIDILNKKKLERCIKNFRPNFIINFAAESHVDRSIERPMSFIETNCLGVINFLQCIKELKLTNITKLVQISTDEVYGEVSFPATENNRYMPNSPYSASKASADLFIRAWDKTFKLKNIILHPSNNYGPRQFPEKLMPLIITNALYKKKLPIYGDGMQTREWIFVDDTVDAILQCLQKKDLIGHLNIGSGQRYTNLQIVKKICLILDSLLNEKKFKHSSLIYFTKDRPGHDKKYAINSKIAINKLGWKPKTTIEDGLLKTVKWYIDNEKWWKEILKKKYDGGRLGLIKK